MYTSGRAGACAPQLPPVWGTFGAPAPRVKRAARNLTYTAAARGGTDPEQKSHATWWPSPQLESIFSIFFCCFSSVFDTLFAFIIKYPLTRSLIQREYRNRYYSVGPYFFAELLARSVFECFNAHQDRCVNVDVICMVEIHFAIRDSDNIGFQSG